MNILSVQRNDRLCKALTGLSVGEFKGLCVDFEWNLREVCGARRSDRKRKMGAGRKGELKTVEHKLVAILMYLKIYTTFDVLGFMLNLDRSNACRDIHFLRMVLEKTLKRKLVLPERKIQSVEEFFRKFPEAKEVFLDGTERRVQKPVSKRRRNKLYSGKKKGTTRKNIVLTDMEKRVLVLTPTKSGRRHDKRLIDKAELAKNIPDDIPIFTDTGALGIQHVHPNTIMPKKRTKKHPLTYSEKETNRFISSLRVIAEHAIAGIKRYNAVSTVYRNRLPNLDDTFMLLSAGLWNYPLSFVKR